MTSLRHAAYRASLLATSAYRIPRVLISRPFQFAQIGRPSIAAFSTRSRLLSEEGFGAQTSSSFGAPPPVAPEGDGKTIYVGNLFFDITNNQLREHFESYGNLENARVVTNAEGLSKGYGFITFETAEAAAAARDATNLSSFAGRRIIVHLAKPMSQRPRDQPGTPSTTLFVGNLSYDMTDKELNELFRPLKNIRDVRVSVDRHTGRPRGFAHADFLDVESAVEAMKQLDGKVVRDRGLRCDYSSSLGRGSRQSTGQQERKDAATFETPRSISSDAGPSQAGNEGSHEPPQRLEDQPEENREKEFEQPEEHATQKLEEEVDKVPEDQAEQK